MAWYDWLNPYQHATSTWDFGKGLFTGTPIQENQGPPGTPTTGQVAPDGRPIVADTGLPTPYGVDEGMRQAYAAQQGGRAGMFADRSEQGYAAYGAQGQSALDALKRQASGQDSVSAEQLRQALGRQHAQQQSFAAGGPPSSASARARAAAIQMGRASTAMAGQQAVAGQQERNQANTAYGNLLSTMRGQDLQASLQSRSNANAGYGAAGGPPQKDWKDYALPAAAAVAQIYAASDRRLKTDVKDGDEGANKMLASLRAFSYRYKDGKKFGEGEYTGPMAQDLERAGSRAVLDTPAGKMVSGARLATENTAMLAALHKRLAKVESKAA